MPAGGAPQATAGLTGGIEVYWTGDGIAGVREAFDSPGTSWHGPRNLGGQMRSAPLPATAAGAVRVLWLGPGHQIEYTEHRSGGNWNALGWTHPATRQAHPGQARRRSSRLAAKGEPSGSSGGDGRKLVDSQS